MPKVSVIVAVYNVAPYIEKCAISLFEQTLDDIEYIFIDDSSKDSSIDILQKVVERYPLRKESIRIIRNSENKGIAYTRTIGMKAALGEYVIHCDPDDYIDPEFYEEMYLKALSTSSDLVVCDYMRHEGTRIKYKKNCIISENPSSCIKNIYRSYFFCAFWSIMVQRRLYVDNNVYPFEGINTGEDLNVYLRLFHYAKKVVKIDKAYYHYYSRPSSLSRNPDKMYLWNNNISKNLNAIIEFFENTGDKSYYNMLCYLVFKKKMFLLSSNPPEYKIWYNSYPKYNSKIFSFESLSVIRKMLYYTLQKSFCLGSIYFFMKKHI